MLFNNKFFYDEHVYLSEYAGATLMRGMPRLTVQVAVVCSLSQHLQLGFTTYSHHGVCPLVYSTLAVVTWCLNHAKCSRYVMPHFVSSMLMVSVFWCISASSRNKLNHAINGNGVETPKELKDWFAAFAAEISGNLLYDVLKSECGIIMIRKIKDALQNKVKQSANAQPHTQPDIQEKAQATGGTKNEWTTVVRKNQRKALVDLALRAREWDAPVLQAHEAITNSTGVAILTKEAAESKLSMVKSTGRLAVLTEQQFPVASHVACKRVQFTCLDGDKIVPREGFLYQLGEAPVRRVVEQGCAVLKQSCATASLFAKLSNARPLSCGSVSANTWAKQRVMIQLTSPSSKMKPGLFCMNWGCPSQLMCGCAQNRLYTKAQVPPCCKSCCVLRWDR